MAAAVPVAAQLRGVELANLTWVQAEKALAGDQVVVIPLGAASKEHGPHLRLDNDFHLAEYFKRRVLAASAVVAGILREIGELLKAPLPPRRVLS